MGHVFLLTALLLIAGLPAAIVLTALVREMYRDRPP